MTLEELIIDCEKHESYSKAMFENNKHLFNEREKDYLKSVHRIHARYLEDLKKLTLPQVSKSKGIEREALLKLKQFIANQKDLPDDINQIVNDNFWELF